MEAYKIITLSNLCFVIANKLLDFAEKILNRNLIAEVEMRIGGSPDPNNPTLPCTKKIDEKVNQCPCAKTEGSW